MTQSEKELPSVLIVDDDLSVREVLIRILSSDFSVTAASTPSEALGHLDDGGRYCAAICDLEMPEMSGVQLLRQIRERDPGIPVIILTGQGSLESAMVVIKYGGFRYLTKPFDEEDLLGAVRAASAVRQMDVLRRRAIEVCDAGGWRATVGRELDQHFDNALKNLFLVYQPILDGRTSQLFGFEALVRSKGPELTNPGLLFGAAERLGRVKDIGREVRRQVARQIHLAPTDAILFVNLHALDLSDEELYAPSAPLSRVSSRVVLEITERMSLDSVDDLTGRVHRLRELGYRIAVDDLGAGYAGLTSFSELTPEVVKLDMSLIRSIDTNPRKQSIVNSLLKVCLTDLDTRVVCEGVETKEERDTLSGLGADLLQGYLLGRPAQEFSHV